MNEVKRTKAEAKAALLKRRAEARARADQAMAVLHATAEAKQHRAALTALDRMIVIGRVLKFDTLETLFRPHVWILDVNGHTVGHALTVEAIAIDPSTGADGVVVERLDEVLRRPWRAPDDQSAWAALYAHALAALAEQAQAHADAIQSAIRLRAALSDPSG
ncbi:hypothetical protein [Luteibacter sahnii]|uniref:hypothetical protein n=1 Tax=Luteibacter sahnii TaxID=3021977 RepID=UPI002A6A2BD6|nr:hypothetical protein [Luteibacter sp. PPL193]MDY1548041.1 hypothetical protein [Luteibacter sp. PPL193]